MEGIGIKYCRIGFSVTPLFSGVLFYNVLRGKGEVEVFAEVTPLSGDIAIHTTVSAIRSVTMLAQLINLIGFVADMFILLFFKKLKIQDVTAMKLDELNKTITLEPELWHGTRKYFTIHHATQWIQLNERKK
jgi:hypothetical protein